MSGQDFKPQPLPYWDLTNQKVLVVGGSSRMGLEVAKLTATNGAEVIISSRSAQKLEPAAATITGRVSTYVADSSDAQTGELTQW